MAVLLSECDRPEWQSPVNYEMPRDANVHVINRGVPGVCGSGALSELPAAEAEQVGAAQDDVDWRIRGDVFVVFNKSASPASFVATLPEACACAAADGQCYPMTWYTTDDDCTMNDINTFVIHIDPQQWLGAFRILKGPTKRDALRRRGGAWAVVPIEPHPAPYPSTPVVVIGFPIRGSTPAEEWRCGQGFEGGLTHFGVYSTHSADFECEEGTAVTAVAAGVVHTVVQKHERSGGHVAHLYRGYNEVVVRHPDGTEACYLHIQKDSAAVKVGDAVAKGQVLAATGSVGFAPWPHIHFQLNYQGKAGCPDDIGATVPFAFEGSPAFVPVAGYTYTVNGRVSG